MAELKDPDPFVLEDVRIIFRNFAGEPDKFNPPGNRNFKVALSEDAEEILKANGWAITYLRPLVEGDPPQPIIKVRARFDKGRPPKVVMLSARGKTELDESTVGLLDYAEILRADMVITPYRWTVGENTGITAYLKTLFVTIREDPLEMKYGDVPDAAQEPDTEGDNPPF